jgi:hypothetical protein
MPEKLDLFSLNPSLLSFQPAPESDPLPMIPFYAVAEGSTLSNQAMSRVLPVAGITSYVSTAATAAEIEPPYTVEINRSLVNGVEVAMPLNDINCRGRDAFPKLH